MSDIAKQQLDKTCQKMHVKNCRLMKEIERLKEKIRGRFTSQQP